MFLPWLCRKRGGRHFDFDAGARYAVRVARLILKEGLPDETLVNLNIPNRPVQVDHRSASHLSQPQALRQSDH